jgi:hypothetical protein
MCPCRKQSDTQDSPFCLEEATIVASEAVSAMMPVIFPTIAARAQTADDPAFSHSADEARYVSNQGR